MTKYYDNDNCNNMQKYIDRSPEMTYDNWAPSIANNLVRLRMGGHGSFALDCRSLFCGNPKPPLAQLWN